MVGGCGVGSSLNLREHERFGGESGRGGPWLRAGFSSVFLQLLRFGCWTEPFHKECDEAFGSFGGNDFGAECDGAVGGVEGDLFDDLGTFRVFARVVAFVVAGGSGLADDGGGRGQVAAGDLEAVEEESGAAGVEFVGGDAAEDMSDGGLEVRAVVGIGEGEVEGPASAAALARIGDGTAGGVVVVAELFLSEAGAGATAAVNEDVAAFVAYGLVGAGAGVGVLHGVSPHWVKLRKVFRTKDLSLDFRSVRYGSAVKGKGPAGGRTWSRCGVIRDFAASMIVTV